MISHLEKKATFEKPQIKWIPLLVNMLFLIPCVLAFIGFLTGIRAVMEVRELCPNRSECCIISAPKQHLQDTNSSTVIINMGKNTFEEIIKKLQYNEDNGKFHKETINVTNIDGKTISLSIKFDYNNIMDIYSDQSKNANPNYLSEYISKIGYQMELEISED
ncbi:uncharacterized protein LOC143197686 [Rhynchophorus ferrugineus]|uniref:uncharacterized protein LOC143197686 n=1 Tax=Rhynchophorus ferrugineus TaxID=354439 RepID=UPI003FCD79C7